MLSVLGTQGWHLGVLTPCQPLGAWRRAMGYPAVGAVGADGVQARRCQWLSEGCHASTHRPLA